MLSNGVIRPSNSPWGSRVILAENKDGAKRFIVDFRALNDCTKKDVYPLPDLHDILEVSSLFSTLDGATCKFGFL